MINEIKRMQQLAGIQLNESKVNKLRNRNRDEFLIEFLELFDSSEGYQGDLTPGIIRSMSVDRRDYTSEYTGEPDDDLEYEYELEMFDKCYKLLKLMGGTYYLEVYETTFEILDENTIQMYWIQPDIGL